MNKLIFETKEQYLAFRKAFAAAQNDKRAKPYFTDDLHAGKIKNKGWLQAEHFILLNAIRGRPLANGFSPIISDNKINSNWGNPMNGFMQARKRLLSAQSNAQRLLAGIPEYKPSGFEARMYEKMSNEERTELFKQKRLDEMDRCAAAAMPILGPFGYTLTIEQFAAMELKVSE